MSDPDCPYCGTLVCPYCGDWANSPDISLVKDHEVGEVLVAKCGFCGRNYTITVTEVTLKYFRAEPV